MKNFTIIEDIAVRLNEELYYHRGHHSEAKLRTCGVRVGHTTTAMVIRRQAGHYSLVGSDVAWESRGTAIDPRVQHIFL